MSTENFLWCKITKEYLGYNEDLYLCFVYIPPECSTREKKINTDHFATIIETNSKIKSDNVLLMGDFNARTLTLPDTLLKEKEDNLPQDFFSRITSKRCNQDLVGNNYGKKLIEYCIATKSYIINGRTIGDFQGKLTCFQPNGASTVDYAIATEPMHKHVSKFEVLDPSCSDHCPIVLELRSKTHTNLNNSGLTSVPPRIHWNEQTKLLLNLKFEAETTKKAIEEVDNLLESSNDIDTITDKLSGIYNIEQNRSKKIRKNQKNNTT